MMPLKIAFIHNDKKIGTGAHYINDLMSMKLQESGVDIKNFYPRQSLVETPVHLSGIKNILFFYSLLEKRRQILKFDLIQGTTYTALPFLAYPIPVVAHFGSTTRGFINSTPQATNIENGCKKVWYNLKQIGVISELNLQTRKPLRDIADIEEYVASKAEAVIATSLNVKKELISSGVPAEKIHIVHNAIEDYWFETTKLKIIDNPHIVFLGRLGSDVFTLKLKGLDRLIHLYQKFPSLPKTTFCMSSNKTVLSHLRDAIPNHHLCENVKKDNLPEALATLCGSILFISSRYEGFSLSLVEGMSQGLIPVAYSVGVVPEIIQNGENGFIVATQYEAIERIKQILADKSLRETLSKNAVKTSKQFSSHLIAKKLIDLYKTVVHEKRD